MKLTLKHRDTSVPLFLNPKVTQCIKNAVGLLCVGFALVTSSAGANPRQALHPSISYLSSQLGTQQNPERSPASESQLIQNLVQSHSDRKRFYTYDQALAAIAFVHEGKTENARKIISAMQSLQDESGSWIFSFPKEPGIHSRSGSVAWMVIAMNHYEQRTRSAEFSASRNRALDYLLRNSFSKKDFFAPRFSHVDDPNTAWNETEVLSVEHLIDTIAAIHTLPISEKKKHDVHLKKLTQTLNKHWIGNRFASGSIPSQGKLQMDEVYLDTQAWSSLLPEKIIDPDKVKSGLSYNCAHFLSQAGFIEANTHSQKVQKNFAWLEGSYSMLLAMKKSGNSCNSKDISSIETSLQRHTHPSGGVPYSINASSVEKDRFTESLSVASTTWKYFSDRNINPFEITIN